MQTNTAATCYEFTRLVLIRIAQDGHKGWGFVGKTRGEGQFSPAVGFPRQVGAHTITGVSHDAIGNATQRVDLLGSGNDGPEPLGRPATPQWLTIPREFWRPNNPIIALEAGAAPAPPPAKIYPGDQFFIEQLGQVLEWDYAEAGQRLNAGSAVWFSRTLWRYLHEGLSIEQSTAQSRKEWRAALGLAP